jgi:uncharacterized protein (UPF0548 family)
MADWRFARAWSTGEIERELAALERLERNFSHDPAGMTSAAGWKGYYSEAVLARERPGPPALDGALQRGRAALANYAFSDPAIVIAHFDPAGPLLGRRMLLEIRALRALRYLAGVVVSAVRDETIDGSTVYGFRYDTLEGHIECGFEWFLLTQVHATGEIRFRIQATWRPGDFPNWWSRAGFQMLAPYYQRAWHHEAHRRLAELMRSPGEIVPGTDERGITHSPPKLTFKRTEARV